MIRPLHASAIVSPKVRPRGMTRTHIAPELRSEIEAQALSIFEDMTNAGCCLQQTLAAIYLSGMNAAMEASK